MMDELLSNPLQVNLMIVFPTFCPSTHTIFWMYIHSQESFPEQYRFLHKAIILWNAFHCSAIWFNRCWMKSESKTEVETWRENLKDLHWNNIEGSVLCWATYSTDLVIEPCKVPTLFRGLHKLCENVPYIPWQWECNCTQRKLANLHDYPANWSIFNDLPWSQRQTDRLSHFLKRLFVDINTWVQDHRDIYL